MSCLVDYVGLRLPDPSVCMALGPFSFLLLSSYVSFGFHVPNTAADVDVCKELCTSRVEAKVLGRGKNSKMCWVGYAVLGTVHFWTILTRAFSYGHFLKMWILSSIRAQSEERNQDSEHFPRTATCIFYWIISSFLFPVPQDHLPLGRRYLYTYSVRILRRSSPVHSI